MLKWRIARCAFFNCGQRDVILRPYILPIILLCAALLSACSPNPLTPLPATAPPTSPAPEHWTPPPSARWQIQFTGNIDPSIPVEIYNLDLLDTTPETIADLHTRGIKVICRFSAGTLEDWRLDTDKFFSSIVGKDVPDHPGEKWLDIRNLQYLAPPMLERISLAAQKGCDGVLPDHVDGYVNDTGFPLTADDQLVYNMFLANAAHQNGLGVGLMNDQEQIPALLPYFDGVLNESCFTTSQCNLLLPFAQAGKAVFVIEYQMSAETFCPQARQLGFNALHKNPALDAYFTSCQ
jgi:hypothetical protein